MEINLGQKIIRKYYAKSIIGLMFSALLIITSLYQLEIILIRVTQNRITFEFPFFLWTTNLWIARDIWYLILIIGWLLGTYSGFKLGELRDFETLLENPSDAAIIKEIITTYQENEKNNQKPK
jgi:formate-dependent nitrite reductase membrane component NrfD